MKVERRYETGEEEEEEEEGSERKVEKDFLIMKYEDYRCLNSRALHTKKLPAQHRRGTEIANHKKAS